jgi:hypothetical protein
MGHAQGRDYEAHRVIALASRTLRELGRTQQRAQGEGNVTVRGREGLGHALDQRGRGRVRQPVLHECAADVARSGRVAGQAVQGLLHFGQAALVQGLT